MAIRVRFEKEIVRQGAGSAYVLISKVLLNAIGKEVGDTLIMVLDKKYNYEKELVIQGGSIYILMEKDILSKLRKQIGDTVHIEIKG